MDFTPGLALEDGLLSKLSTLPEEEEDQDDNYEGVKKRLFDSGDLETPVTKTTKQPVLVYLRIRPKSQLELLNKDPDCLHVYDDNELLAVAPKSSQTYKNKLGTRCLQEGSQKFSFTKVFRPQTTQKELFDDTLRSTLKDFFGGQNCLLFTYGVTNSGKTYTVTGTPTDPGILPRSLDVIFNSIDQQQLSHVSVKPRHFSEVVYLSKEEASAMETSKDNTLNKAREMMLLSQGQLPGQQAVGEAAVGDETELLGEHDISSVSTISKASSNLTDIDGGSFAEFQHDESSIELDCFDNQQFSIWVSFAEIYNEFIYDLLADPPTKGKQRTVLKIAEDKNRNHFIKGLQEVRVSTVDEAMLLLRLGLQHRHVAHTKLNYNSSRSHSIYTIKLIRLVNMDKPSRALVNRISIVDLAGAERSAKTGASGVRIKEAGNINNSLLTLGKCIEAMRYNQSKKGSEERVVPFRESKLTRLFQNYFVGTGKGKSLRQGKITMFVNVSNNASVFDETVHVLKFSALTSKIIPTTKVVHGLTFASTSTCPPPSSLRPPSSHQPPTITSLTAARTERKRDRVAAESREGEVTSMTWETEDNLPAFTADSTECSKCKYLSGQLAQCTEEAKAKISELQVKLIEQEYTIRQEVSQEFSEQLTEIEDQHTRELEEQAVEYEEMYEKRFKLLQQSAKRVTSRKRRRQDDDETDVSDHSRRAEVANLKERISELEEELAMEKNRAAAEVHDAMETYESKVVMLNKQLVDMAMKSSSLEKESNSERQSLKTQLQAAMEKVDQLSAKLEEEREMFRVQREEHEDDVLQLREKCSELRNELKETQLKQTAELQERLSMVERKNTDLTQEASDARAEEEILQARISELTSENSTLEVTRCELIEQLQKLTTEKETFETGNTELKQLSEQREMELIAEAERQSKEICTLEEKLAVVQEELSTSLAQVKELTGKLTTVETAKSELESRLQQFVIQRETKQATESNELIQERLLLEEKDKELTALRVEGQAHKEHTQELEEKLVALQGQLDGSMKQVKELTSENAQIETLRCDLNSSLAKLAMKQEAMYKLEEAKENLEKEVCELRLSMKVKEESVAKLTSQVTELNEKHALYESFMKTLKEYETTLEKQSTYIREVEEEKEGLHTQNEELLQKVTEMEHQLAKATTARDSLNTKIEELKKALEDSHQKLSQREAELMDGASKCREAMENQQADLRRQCSSLEQEVTTLKEDGKALQQQLREKESELLSLARSVGVEKSALADVNQRLEEARLLADQKQSQLEAMQGNHQLEVAQLNIKLREVTAELEEAHLAYSQQLVPSSSSTEGVRGSSGEDDEHIYEEPPEEGGGDGEDPIYDTVADVSATQPLASVENKPAKARRSYLEAVGGHGAKSAVKDDLDLSKPYVPVLESSSQLIDDSFLDESSRMEIDATPLPLRKKARKLKAKSAKARKRSIEAVDKENDQHGGSPLPKKTRPQRTRAKPQRYEEEVSSIDNFTPVSQKAYKQKTLRQRLLGTGKGKKSTKAISESTPANIEEKTGKDCIASRTRQRKCVLTKSQISGPLELRDSPKGSRNALEAKGMTQLGAKMRPVSNNC